MPHVTMEYSTNLEKQTDVGQLCRIARSAMMGTGLFETGAVRVRAIECEHYSIADEHGENAFLAILVRIGAGRTLEEKKRVGEMLSAALEDALKSLFEKPHFALSVDIIENEPALSWKKNSMHARLRKA